MLEESDGTELRDVRFAHHWGLPLLVINAGVIADSKCLGDS